MNQIQQTKYPDFIITFDIANFIVDILIEHCGVSPNRRKNLVEDFMWTQPTEYRFQGNLGLGGKLYNDSKLKVNCYPEDRTPKIDLMIQDANTKLKELYDKECYTVFNKAS
jgi:hypothetical protein